MALAGVKAAKEESARRQKAGGGFGNITYFKAAEGQPEVVRPLEQGDDFTHAYVHSVKVTHKGKDQYRDAVCLDQTPRGGTVPCPGCEERAKIANPKDDRRYRRSFKFWLNVIWRDGPIYEIEEIEKDDKKYERFVKDAQGNLNEIGRGDVLALWSGGIRAAEELDFASDEYGGLVNRDYKIVRKGDGLDTTYKVVPARDEDGNELPAGPLSNEDEKIVDKKPDLSNRAEPTSYDDFWESVGTGGGTGGTGPSDEQTRSSGSPFRRKREATS